MFEDVLEIGRLRLRVDWVLGVNTWFSLMGCVYVRVLCRNHEMDVWFLNI